MPEPSPSSSPLAASTPADRASPPGPGPAAEAPEALVVTAEVDAYGGAVLAEEGGVVSPPGARPRRGRGRVGFWLAVAWLAAVALLAVLGPVLPFVDDPYAVDAAAAKQGPSGAHWLGGDEIGRDLFARVVYASRNSLFVGVAAAAVGLAVGGLLGLVAGYFRGRAETAIMGVTDVLLAFPALILALAIVSFLGQSLLKITLALGILSIPAITRVTRANTLVFAQREFVLAARTLGARSRRVMFREVLPNVVPPLLSYTLVVIAVLIIAEGSLSFLGLGVPAPNPTFGGMINGGRGDLRNAAHISLLPSLALFLTILAFNFLGDSLRSRFDVRESGL